MGLYVENNVLKGTIGIGCDFKYCNEVIEAFKGWNGQYGKYRIKLTLVKDNILPMFWVRTTNGLNTVVTRESFGKVYWQEMRLNKNFRDVHPIPTFVAQHEFGHILGFSGHRPDSTNSIMSYSKKARILHSDVKLLVNAYGM